jgi:DNA mismatch repair protein MutS
MALNLGFAEDENKADEVAKEVKDALQAIEPDELTPKQALDALYQLKKIMPK